MSGAASRCLVTGNLCGTDTRPKDQPCGCSACTFSRSAGSGVEAVVHDSSGDVFADLGVSAPPSIEAVRTLASWMISHGYATGHGDSVEGLLAALSEELGQLHLTALEGRAETSQLRADIARLRSDIARKDEALKPFAKSADAMDKEWPREKDEAVYTSIGPYVYRHGEWGNSPESIELTHGDFRRARAALLPLAPGSKGDAS